jgi:hypothetical protein
LEDGAVADTTTIRQWKLDNYLCKLQNVFTMAAGSFQIPAGHKFQSSAFSVEHYHTTLSTSTASGTSTIYLSDYSQDASMSFTTTSGDGVILNIGPNDDGDYDNLEVATTISGGVTTATPIQHSYDANTPVSYYTHIWMFNDFDGADSSTGALYKFDGYTGDYLKKYPGGEYKNVDAATFYKVDSFAEHGNIDTLCFVKGTNMLFININDIGGELVYYGSMVMDNVRTDEATLIDIYDVTMDDQNVYRLQQRANYYDTDYVWTYYNYQLSSLDSFVSSISLAAYPAIIAANASSTTNITAIVKDQFLQPIVSRAVTFSEDDGVGILIGSNPINTDSDGEAGIVYQSGTTAREVTITAVVEQSA